MKASALLLIAVLLTPLQAMAADEFGSRFGNTAPAALGETAPKNDLLAFTPEQLEAIQTAAGDEQGAAEKFGPPVPASLAQPKIPQSETPQQ